MQHRRPGAPNNNTTDYPYDALRPGLGPERSISLSDVHIPEGVGFLLAIGGIEP